MIGMIIAQSGDSKYLTILIGAVAAIFAFIGVIYSKQQERLLKEYEFKRGKIEEFVFHSFKLIETLSKAVAHATKIQKNEIKSVGSAEESALDRQIFTDMMAEISLLVGQCYGYIALYKDDIASDDKITKLQLAQEKANNSIITLMLKKSGSSDDKLATLTKNVEESTRYIKELRQLSLEIVGSIKISS